MRRFIYMLPLGVAGLLALVGFFVAPPNAPAASVYPTAVQNFDASTAWSIGCVFPRICHAGQTCWVGTDPNEGCQFTNGGRNCQGCLF